MLCGDCCKVLYCNLSPPAIAVLKTISHHRAGLNQRQIIKLTGLSTSITRDALNELRGAMMVTAAIKGRGIYYAPAEGVAEVVGAVLSPEAEKKVV